MKKTIAFCMILIMLLSGCNTNKKTNDTALSDFKFASVEWGDDWETVQTYEIFKGVNILKENGGRKTVKLQQGEFLGVPLEDLGLVFSKNKIAETEGLVNVLMPFEEQHQDELLLKLTELYGERKTSYLDKNGVENPINPAGWVSNETIEEVLTDEEKDYYISLIPKDYDQSRIDAMLRSPLVSIRLDEENNFIEFNGNTAAIVRYIKSKYNN